MSFLNRVCIGIKALAQLGPEKVWQYAIYQFGLRSGIYRFKTPTSGSSQFLPDYALKPNWFFKSSEEEDLSSLGASYKNKILAKGEEILNNYYHPFGGNPQPLDLELDFPLDHWTYYEIGRIKLPFEDIKLVWEPARFDWAVELSKAYHVSKDERYPGKFRELYTDFRRFNPLNSGPNWQSAQEVALRLIALVTSLQLMHSSESLDDEFLLLLSGDIADHAERILPTLSYAKAQANNHLLSEAAGLYTAGLFLKSHPRSPEWKEIGRSLFKKAIQDQIEADGEYCQHSTNYHRMMLILALWMRNLLKAENKDFSQEEYIKLGKASEWLIAQNDELSGHTTNLGHNDGSFILPFTCSDYSDYRPIIQASNTAFSGKKVLQDGEWNDLSIWLVSEKTGKLPKGQNPNDDLSHTRIGNDISWAILRSMHYKNRPAHADQLHIDLWFMGTNVLMDAGTYLYNAPPPWMNALAATLVHNTVCVDGRNQMTRSGRFLWLDWAQAKILETNEKLVRAQHDGYQNLGIYHQRELKKITDTHWEIIDRLIPSGKNIQMHEFFIHWLLPDCPYFIEEGKIKSTAPFGEIALETTAENKRYHLDLSIIRAGKTIEGLFRSPNLGWYSPTYNEKMPALSLLYQLKAQPPAVLRTSIKFMAK